jgi:dolichol-phosphate mannosyltransferase
MNIAIILPTYNEKENITLLIETLEKKVFPGIKNHKMYIIVADDNSPDGTAKEVTKLSKRWKNIFLSLGQRQGIGAAYTRAMSFAVKEINAQILIGMDADGQHNPQRIPQFIKGIENGYDIVVGSRYIKGGSIPKSWNILRKFLSVIGNIIISITLREFAIHDWTNSYRAIRKEVFIKEKTKLINYKGNTFLPALLYESIRDGFKITEIPVEFNPRKKGLSKIIPQEYIKELTKYIIRKKIQ